MMLKEKFHLLRYLSDGIKSDGVLLDKYRDISYEVNTIKTAEGSCDLKLGNTHVIAGVKFEMGTPYEDTPDEGGIMINVELLPLSSPDYFPGPPTDKAIELSRVIDRGIRESGAVDLKSLCIVEGEQVLTVVVDVCAINDDGNLLDAGALASLIALKNAKIPKIENGKIDYTQLTKDTVKLKELPITITCYKIGEYVFVDPTTYEEKYYDSRLTITTIDDSSIVALQKGGEKAITISDVDKMTDLALTKSKEIRKMIKK